MQNIDKLFEGAFFVVILVLAIIPLVASAVTAGNYTAGTPLALITGAFTVLMAAGGLYVIAKSVTSR
jgi:hypothetical protein